MGLDNGPVLFLTSRTFGGMGGFMPPPATHGALGRRSDRKSTELELLDLRTGPHSVTLGLLRRRPLRLCLRYDGLWRPSPLWRSSSEFPIALHHHHHHPPPFAGPPHPRSRPNVPRSIDRPAAQSVRPAAPPQLASTGIRYSMKRCQQTCNRRSASVWLAGWRRIGRHGRADLPIYLFTP